MTEAAGFKRLWSTPRRCSRGGLLDYPTPQQRYLRMQSLVRYRRRPDAYEPGKELLTGELGHIDSFRFITSPRLPDPDTITFDLVERLAARLREPSGPPVLVFSTPNGREDDWITRGYQAALRSGTSAILMGLDLASGPDWTAVYSWPDLAPQPVHPDWTPQDLERLAKAALKRARKADKLRQLAARGAIARA
jgi:hypothetical protein